MNTTATTITPSADRNARPRPDHRLSWLFGRGAAIIAAALALAALVVWNTLAQAGAPIAPRAVLRFAPAQPVALAETALPDVLARRAAVPSGRASALRAYAGDFLNADALVAVATGESLEGREPRAVAILEQARRLTLRNRITNLALIDAAIASRDPARVAREFDIALRAGRRTGETLFPRLIGLLPDPALETAIAARLAGAPLWRPGFLREVGEVPEQADAAFRIMARLHALGAPPSDAEGASYFLVGAAAVPADRVMRQWTFLYGPAGTGENLLFDGDFRGRPGPPPINWHILGGDNPAQIDAGVDADGSGVLTVNVASAQPAPFARQLLALPAGRYRVMLAGGGGADDQPGELTVSLVCRSDGRILAERALTLSSSRPDGLDVTVDSGCDGPFLVLAARLRPDQLSARLSISAASVTPVRPDAPVRPAS